MIHSQSDARPEGPNGFEDGPIARRLFDEIGAFSADTTGYSRPAFSPVETKTLHYLETQARAQD